MLNKVIITGANGFAGSALIDSLKESMPHVEILGVDIIAGNRLDCKVVAIDVTNFNAMTDLIEGFYPDAIVHLAGIYGSSQFTDVLKTNILSIAAIHESVRIVKPDTIILSAGSAAEYGAASNFELPINELKKCLPVNSNGLSKLLSTQIALNYFEAYSLKTMIVRPFQLIGKGISSKLVPGAFYNEIIKARNMNDGTIKVGNLNSYRDFVDVYDLADAVIKLIIKPKDGEIFNVCCGSPVKILDLLELMIDKSGYNVKIEVDPARYKVENDPSIIYGSYNKLFNHCKWEPSISLEQSIENMFK